MSQFLRYTNAGVQLHGSIDPEINWNHIDGPLLHTSDGSLHWLTILERLLMWLDLLDIETLDVRYRGLGDQLQ